ncbi:MAG TPA: DUF4352 domain-containing protein [Planctomycetota bacterium]|nr:DUF4352 domain-containing protein [Planctomycetota bacterium]
MRIAMLMIVLLALGAVALFQYRSMPSVAFTGGVGDEIHIDDFGATLLGSHRQAGLGEGPSRVGAKGVFVLVDVRISNHAKRVNFEFKDSYLRLVDSQGREHEVAPEAQKYLRTSHADGCGSALPPGGMCTTQLVYDVPLDATELSLRLRFAGQVFDMLDTILFGKQRLKLP